MGKHCWSTLFVAEKSQSGYILGISPDVKDTWDEHKFNVFTQLYEFYIHHDLKIPLRFYFIILDKLNTTRVYNEETLRELLTGREAGRGLVTVCNHNSCIDDPVTLAGLFVFLLLNVKLMIYIVSVINVTAHQVKVV